MSWFGHTLSPTLEAVFASHEAPASPQAAAAECRAAGYEDVAKFLESLDDAEYENLTWQCHVAAINAEHPSGFTTDSDDLSNYEHAMELKS